MTQVFASNILRNCRKISDTDCAGYFFEGVCQKRRRSGLRRGFLTYTIGEIDKSRCVTYFSIVPKYKQVRYVSYMTLRFSIEHKKYSLRIMTSGKHWVDADSTYVNNLIEEMKMLTDLLNHKELFINNL